ncbi:putative RNA-directed DNA polymerase from transposon BS [Trichonephila clavipes]|nr:putative RNA-directed DNA polymerase from transposon BS [Trichonephila clavipes]
MKDHIYRDVILEQHVRLFRAAMGAELLFIDDNARPHRVNIVDECLQSEDITRMDWPAYSPDFNPIEHVWDMLGRRIAPFQPPPICLPELRRALLDEWCNIPQNQIHNLILSMPRRSIIGIGGEPKSIKKLRSGDLLIETTSALQSKSFLLAKTFLDFPLSVTPHRSLNSCRGIISKPDLLCSSETEILEGLSDQGVTQVRRITIKKDSSLFPTKHLILTFNSPKLPSTIKAGYLNCKVRPYIPNPLRCFKCQRFGHSQTSCSGQLICSRSASLGHSSIDCNLEPKYINRSQPHSADSKLCPKLKTENQMQKIKTNKNITYLEARKLIGPPLSQTYPQAAKSSITSSFTQSDENIKKK